MKRYRNHTRCEHCLLDLPAGYRHATADDCARDLGTRVIVAERAREIAVKALSTVRQSRDTWRRKAHVLEAKVRELEVIVQQQEQRVVRDLARVMDAIRRAS